MKKKSRMKRFDSSFMTLYHVYEFRDNFLKKEMNVSLVYETSFA